MPQIVTVGEGWVEETGDRAEVTVGFAAEHESRAAAVDALAAQVRGVTFEGPGVEVRHRRLWVHPRWDADGRMHGCRAGEVVTLRVTDVAVLEDLLSRLVAAEPAELSGPHWVLADPSAARRAAQARAVADARDRAEGYAAALGARLGGLLRLTEEQGHGVFETAQARGFAGDGTHDLALAPEPVRVTVRCTTTWAVDGL